MRPVWRIARREWMEQVRQPGALLAPILTFLVIDGVVAAVALLLGQITATASPDDLLARLGVQATVLTGAASLVVHTHAFLGFSQLIGLCAVNAGHAVLHDRQLGTLSFLLLAPLRRWEFLCGKLLGSTAIPLIAGSVLNLAGALVLATSAPTAAAGAGLLPTEPAWWVAWALGCPAWCLLVSAVATVVGALSRDVRSAQQAVWFVLLFSAVFASTLLTAQMAAGPWAELAVAGVGAGGTIVAIATGAAVLSRDLWR